MPLPYKFSDRSEAREDIQVRERAIVLGCAADPCAPTEPGGWSRVSEVLMGLRPWASVAPKEGGGTIGATQALNFGCGAELALVTRGSAGKVVDFELARRVIAKEDTEIAALGTAELSRAILSNQLERFNRSRPYNGGARLLEEARRSPDRTRVRVHRSPPVVVLSTCGDPAEAEPSLRSYLSNLATFGHQDVSIAVLDDSLINPDGMADAIEGLRESFRNPIVHIPQLTRGGSPGIARLIRRELGSALNPAQRRIAKRVFGPSLAGTANLAFWLLSDRELIFVDEDSRPTSVHTQNARTFDEPSGGFDLNRERTSIDVSFTDPLNSAAGDLASHEVDFAFHVDWLLDAMPHDVSIRQASAEWPTREDIGYERVQGRADESGGPISVCVFHLSGHADVRARLLHNWLMNENIDEQDATLLLRGHVPFSVIHNASTPVITVQRSKTSFGSAIGFSRTQSFTPLTMPATRLRYMDLGVGELLNLMGRATVAWAGGALHHFRGTTTGSGRGELAPYLLNEDFLWAALAALRDRGKRLEQTSPVALADALRKANEEFALPLHITAIPFFAAVDAMNELARRSEHWAEPYRLSLGAAYQIFDGSSADIEDSFWRFHRRSEDLIRHEMARLSDQMSLWASLPDPRSVLRLLPRVRQAMTDLGFGD